MHDLILLNGKVITMDPALPEARCVAIRGGRIVEVAFAQPSSAMGKGIRTIDIGGRTVLPGFVDAHCHLAAFAESLVSLSLSPQEGVDSIATIQDRIRGFCEGRAPGTWVRGRGYNEFYLAEKRHPCRRDLDAAAPAHPVKLTHRSGHAHVLNSLALKLAGITAESGDPPGGMIDRAPDTGEPTGILYGMGGYLAQRIPPIDEQEIERGLAGVNERLLSCGITSVQDASAHNDLRQWKRFEGWKARGILGPRITMMMGLAGFGEWKRRPYSTRVGEDQLRLGGVKIVVDEVTGSLHPERKKLNRRVSEIHRAGLQAAIHAVEEPVIEAACDAIEYALRALPRPDHRHRIEHCSVCPPSLVSRLRGLGIAVSTQPAFVYYNGDQYLKTVPERQRQHLYPIGTMIKRGLLVAAGSDAPIADPNPLVGVCAANTRGTAKGASLLPKEGTTVFEALRMYTLSAAKAAFEEGLKGSMTPGKLADLVVLNADPQESGADRLKDVLVDMTIIGGEVVWERPGS
jgi:hypothetical protein